MATSGTRAFSLDVATAIEEAYELAGLEARTSYDAVTAVGSAKYAVEGIILGSGTLVTPFADA